MGLAKNRIWPTMHLAIRRIIVKRSGPIWKGKCESPMLFVGLCGITHYLVNWGPYSLTSQSSYFRTSCYYPKKQSRNVLHCSALQWMPTILHRTSLSKKKLVCKIVTNTNFSGPLGFLTCWIDRRKKVSWRTFEWCSELPTCLSDKNKFLH